MGSHILPGGDEDAAGYEGAGGVWKASMHVSCCLLQHGWSVVLPVVDVPCAPRGVEVGQEGSDDGEICWEVVVHVLGFTWEILAGDDPVGAHL